MIYVKLYLEGTAGNPKIKYLKIQPNVRLEPIQRHREAPVILQCEDMDEERKRILELIEEDRAAGGSVKLGIICKSYALAEELYQWLVGHGAEQERLHLLTYDSEKFYDGVMVTAVSMSRGLEFDRVVIPDVDDNNYHDGYDRGLLYVACTRAMHGLTLLYCGTRSRCLGIVKKSGGSKGRFAPHGIKRRRLLFIWT